MSRLKPGDRAVVRNRRGVIESLDHHTSPERFGYVVVYDDGTRAWVSASLVSADVPSLFDDDLHSVVNPAL